MISDITPQSELVIAWISLNKDEETAGKEHLDKQNTGRTGYASVRDIHFPRPAASSEGTKPAGQSCQFCCDLAELPRKINNSSSIT